jgi:hypothetical protein
MVWLPSAFLPDFSSQYPVFEDANGCIATLDDLDDPINPSASTSDRTPLTGNIQSQGSSSRNTQSYLTSQIPGEDRRAPVNTIDESVWETLARDLNAVWEKMKLVLWPKYLLGGMLMRDGGGIGAEERGEAAQSLMGGEGNVTDRLRGIVGRWPDADVVLQGGMSEGLRDWDLWYEDSFVERTQLIMNLGVHCYSAFCSASFFQCLRKASRRNWSSPECSPWCGLARPL